MPWCARHADTPSAANSRRSHPVHRPHHSSRGPAAGDVAGRAHCALRPRGGHGSSHPSAPRRAGHAIARRSRWTPGTDSPNTAAIVTVTFTCGTFTCGEFHRRRPAAPSSTSRATGDHSRCGGAPGTVARAHRTWHGARPRRCLPSTSRPTPARPRCAASRDDRSRAHGCCVECPFAPPHDATTLWSCAGDWSARNDFLVAAARPQHAADYSDRARTQDPTSGHDHVRCAT